MAAVTGQDTPAMRSIRTRLSLFALFLALLALTGCAAPKMDRGNALDAAQYAWSAAIRWGDFEGALNLLDPAYRTAHPTSDIDLERYKQFQVSGYTELGARVTGDTAVREIQIGVINRNTLVERSVRYTEQWHYDATAKTWWVESGLPNLSESR
jgi:hypothetical protein